MDGRQSKACEYVIWEYAKPRGSERNVVFIISFKRDALVGPILQHEIEFSTCEASMIDQLSIKKYTDIHFDEIIIVRWQTSYKYLINVLLRFLQCINTPSKSLTSYDRLATCGVQCDKLQPKPWLKDGKGIGCSCTHKNRLAQP